MLATVLIPLTLAAQALAAPTSLRAVWTLDKVESTRLVRVYNDDLSEFHGESDGDAVETGNFTKFPLAFDVNEHGHGTISLGNVTYKARHKTAESGGLVCTKMLNPDFSKVDCLVPGLKGFHPTPLTTSAKRSAVDSVMPHLAMVIPNVPMLDPQPEEPDVDKRLVNEICSSIGTTVLVGDGNPHQNYLHKQISETINCGGAATCNAGYTETQSFAIGFSYTLKLEDWAQFGFSVTQSWTTGNMYNCGGTTGEDVCIWYNTAHTAITVRNENYITAGCGIAQALYSEDIILKSPNEQNRGGGYYCFVDPCRAKGDGYWDNSGPVGGA
ncbi:hypothetical protein B0J13DRAFT_648348 [Dactylonectria estremocensis]|uniref:Uncharacterized protein n=1 Tax=Dactylonectria estremocensis TaxID=1079267 RepID=A0A9P9IIT9_9HYPO|nr:hypothetical protein B0J13DRAFT_648348 [Dactylonectria estremocensis]